MADGEDLVPRPRPGYRTPPRQTFASTMSVWSPVVAGMLRGVAGVLAYAASLLAMPVHAATPFLVGVSLVMLVGGCVATLRATREDPRLRQVGRWFCILAVVCILGASAIAVALGPGAFAPDVPRPARAPVDDGAIRFEG